MKQKTPQLVYECLGCGEKISYEKLRSEPSFKCPRCQYKIFKKIRPPVSRIVEAP